MEKTHQNYIHEWLAISFYRLDVQNQIVLYYLHNQ